MGPIKNSKVGKENERRKDGQGERERVKRKCLRQVTIISISLQFFTLFPRIIITILCFNYTLDLIFFRIVLEIKIY